MEGQCYEGWTFLWEECNCCEDEGYCYMCEGLVMIGWTFLWGKGICHDEYGHCTWDER